MATLYKQLVAISERFLGPAGERFISRHISSHLNIKPKDITRDKILELSNWTKISISLLTDDKKQVEEFNNAILKLAEG